VIWDRLTSLLTWERKEKKFQNTYLFSGINDFVLHSGDRTSRRCTSFSTHVLLKRPVLLTTFRSSYAHWSVGLLYNGLCTSANPAQLPLRSYVMAWTASTSLKLIREGFICLQENCYWTIDCVKDLLLSKKCIFGGNIPSASREICCSQGSTISISYEPDELNSSRPSLALVLILFPTTLRHFK